MGYNFDSSSHRQPPVNSTPGHFSTPECTRSTPIGEKASVDSMLCVELSWKEQGVSRTSREVLLQSWKSSTKVQYRPYIKKWQDFCANRNINPVKPTAYDVVNFLGVIFETGVGYSALGTARSALSTFLVCEGRPVGEHPLVCRFMKGVFVIRPSFPRYQVIWDVKQVFKVLRKMHPPESLSLKDLTLKLVTMLALLAGQRHQTLKFLDIFNMSITADCLKFRIVDILKHTRPGHHIPELVFPAYEVEDCLCPVTYALYYLRVTKLIRMKESRFFISYVKPHKAVCTNTISRWIKFILVRAKIDMSIFTPYSTRSASSSKAGLKVQTGTILRTVGWSSERTYARFYKKKIVKEGCFAKAVLEAQK